MLIEKLNLAVCVLFRTLFFFKTTAVDLENNNQYFLKYS
jgi:hypothetical protein